MISLNLVIIATEMTLQRAAYEKFRKLMTTMIAEFIAREISNREFRVLWRNFDGHLTLLQTIRGSY